jgi:hypothetical protein
MAKSNMLKIIFCAAIVLALGASAWAFVQPPPVPGPVEEIVKVTVPPEAEINIVTTPEQTGPERPAGLPEPAAEKIQLPGSANLAEGAEVKSGPITQNYRAPNAVDGKPLTYWESAGLPAEITVDLKSAKAVKTVAVKLNPDPIWSARTQTFAIQGSADGSAFTDIVAQTKYEFDPATGNVVRVDFDAATVQYVRLVFTTNSGTNEKGAQAAEIMVFE